VFSSFAYSNVDPRKRANYDNRQRDRSVARLCKQHRKELFFLKKNLIPTLSSLTNSIVSAFPMPCAISGAGHFLSGALLRYALVAQATTPAVLGAYMKHVRRFSLIRRIDETCPEVLFHRVQPDDGEPHGLRFTR